MATNDDEILSPPTTPATMENLGWNLAPFTGYCDEEGCDQPSEYGIHFMPGWMGPVKFYCTTHKEEITSKDDGVAVLSLEELGLNPIIDETHNVN